MKPLYRVYPDKSCHDFLVKCHELQLVRQYNTTMYPKSCYDFFFQNFTSNFESIFNMF